MEVILDELIRDKSAGGSVSMPVAGGGEVPMVIAKVEPTWEPSEPSVARLTALARAALSAPFQVSFSTRSCLWGSSFCCCTWLSHADWPFTLGRGSRQNAPLEQHGQMPYPCEAKSAGEAVGGVLRSLGALGALRCLARAARSWCMAPGRGRSSGRHSVQPADPEGGLWCRLAG